MGRGGHIPRVDALNRENKTAVAAAIVGGHPSFAVVLVERRLRLGAVARCSTAHSSMDVFAHVHERVGERARERASVLLY